MNDIKSAPLALYILGLACLSTIGCGNKGALYLPGSQPVTNAKQESQARTSPGLCPYNEMTSGNQ